MIFDGWPVREPLPLQVVAFVAVDFGIAFLLMRAGGRAEKNVVRLGRVRSYWKWVGRETVNRSTYDAPHATMAWGLHRNRYCGTVYLTHVHIWAGPHGTILPPQGCSCHRPQPEVVGCQTLPPSPVVAYGAAPAGGPQLGVIDMVRACEHQFGSKICRKHVWRKKAFTSVGQEPLPQSDIISPSLSTQTGPVPPSLTKMFQPCPKCCHKPATQKRHPNPTQISQT
jgi:hypothetical protein